MQAMARSIWQEVVKNLRRTLGKNWRLFRKSKTGLVGLGIIVTFLFMAVSAPLLTPFTPGYLAPSVDILQTDMSQVSLPKGGGWSTPIGVVDQGVLSQVLSYSRNGSLRVAEIGSGLKSGVVGLVVKSTSNASLRPGIRLLLHEPYDNTSYLILAGDDLLLYTEQFHGVRNTSMGFIPQFQSEPWNTEQIGTKGFLLMATANSTHVWLYAMAPRNAIFNPSAPKLFVHPPVAVPGGVVGDPIILFLPQDNLTELVVPTAAGLVAYQINLVQQDVFGAKNVSDIALGAMVWNTAATTPGTPFTPIGGHPVTLPATEPLVDAGKDTVAVATSDARVLAFSTRNGSLAWTSTPAATLGSGLVLTGIYSAGSQATLLVRGTLGTEGVVAVLDSATGAVGEGGKQARTFPAQVTAQPTWIRGGLRWFLTTATGDFYVLDEDLAFNATYRPAGPAGTPGAYLGNIFQTGQTQTGNYYGTTLDDSTMVLLLLPGQNVAPLRPGTYPSGNRYILGTDEAGHDLWTWLVYGSQSELLLGITAALFAVGLGTLVGLVAGYKGGMVDTVLMRTVDIFLALPGLVLILLLIVVLGPSLVNIILIVGLLSWAPISRVIRSVTLSLKTRAYVDAARVAGASPSRIVFRHIAPNVLPLTFLYMSITVSTAIILEALLSFLGFGDASHVTWGMSLQFLEISGHVLNAPWWLFPPGIAISLISLSFYLVGRAMDEIVNPKLRAR